MKVVNPFLPLNEYIPDGEPHVFGDRVYLFGSHDKADGDTYCMDDYKFYSAPIDDLTNWTAKGVSYKATQAAGHCPDTPFMYAPDCVRGNDGKYYLYYSCAGRTGDGGYSSNIEVAVSDCPDGPYEFHGIVSNPDGTPLNRFIPFDPAVINDDGVIRLYYGAGYPFENYNIPILKSMLLNVEHKMFGKSIEEIKNDPEGINGANTVILADDMKTVIVPPKKITPNITKGTQWEAHPFFEASSIRKIGDTYYFIYSSQQGHELCYATSLYPDRDFEYRGVIISNGDIGYKGRKKKDRIAMTGNNHGSIECINGKWYIFYHRQTNGTNFSRQACVEPIEILEDGSIPQVSMSSMGFNGDAYTPAGEYSAAIACILRGKKVAKTSYLNANNKGMTCITQKDDEVYITNIKKDIYFGIRYFRFENKPYNISISCRGAMNGYFEIYDNEGMEQTIGIIEVTPSKEWKEFTSKVTPKNGIRTLMFVFKGKGNGEVNSIIFK